MSRMLSMLDPLGEIRRIYFSTTRETIERDMARALELLKHMPDDETRQRAAGYMHGLSDLKREWSRRTKTKKRSRAAKPAVAPKPPGHGGVNRLSPSKKPRG